MNWLKWIVGYWEVVCIENNHDTDTEAFVKVGKYGTKKEAIEFLKTTEYKGKQHMYIMEDHGRPEEV